MIKSHKQLTASLLVSAVIVTGLGVFSPQKVSANSSSSNSVMTASAIQTAIIESSVRLRSTPSTNGTIVKYLKKGEQVNVLEKTNKYWYQVRTASGNIGYISSNAQYISLVGNTGGTVTPAPTPPTSTPGASTQIERVISAGMKYLGTPYEYGSSRNNTSTFDCSDFIRQMFLDAANLKLPADSRQQGDWVKQNSTVVTSTAGLKRGDLMFFMSYKGNSASAYAGIDKSNAKITHVAMYLGDGQILHTYSVASGGVKVDKLSASWMNRFLFGGSVIR